MRYVKEWSWNIYGDGDGLGAVYLYLFIPTTKKQAVKVPLVRLFRRGKTFLFFLQFYL